MSFLATLRTTPIAGQNVTYTFSNSVDTTTFQGGQAFDVRSYLYNIGVIRNLNITTRLTLIIPNGVTLGSSDATKPVLTIAGFKSRDKVIIINNGNIYGKGGYGGLGGATNGALGSMGSSGGTAIKAQTRCIIYNNGSIYGGGGGGQGGTGTLSYNDYYCNDFCGKCYNGGSQGSCKNCKYCSWSGTRPCGTVAGCDGPGQERINCQSCNVSCCSFYVCGCRTYFDVAGNPGGAGAGYGNNNTAGGVGAYSGGSYGAYGGGVAGYNAAPGYYFDGISNITLATVGTVGGLTR